MDGAMGQEEDVVEAVLTCEGDFHDPELSSRIERFRHCLKDLLLTEKQKLQVKRVEPWNSVKVTFTIPRDAAIRLRQLAQNGNDTLRQMGVLSVQIQGDSQISLTIAGSNNEATELVLRTPSTQPSAGSLTLPFNSVDTDSIAPSSDELPLSPGPSDEVTRKNIVDYLKQGPHLLQNAALIDSFLQGPAGASSVPRLGMGLNIPPHSDSFFGPGGVNPPFRPNSFANMAVQNHALRGSQISSSFPFTKTAGAFHPPISRLPPSAGQSSVSHTSSLRPIRPQGQSTALVSQANLSNSGSDHHGLTTNMNSFSPVGSIRLPASSSTNFTSQIPYMPPSSSPPSNFIDLPPPPPYPHSTSTTSRPGKPVTASSPLLVNLLQTDPLSVAAGMASGNANKPMTAGDSSGPSPKKKRRSKKSKDGLIKLGVIGEVSSSKTGFHPGVLASSGMDVTPASRMLDDSPTPGLSVSSSMKDPFSVDLVQSRAGAVPASHIADSFTPGVRPDNSKPFLSDRPFSESQAFNPSSAGFQPDSSSRSAIGMGTDTSSKCSDSNEREHFPADLDPFTLEIAAGKIINPYTGQLEPRDSAVDTSQVRYQSNSQGDNFATQMLAKKAKELEEMNKKSVPNSSSQGFDVNMRTVIPAISVSTSTAAIARSGGLSQVSSDRFISSIPAHRRKLINDNVLRDLKESPTPPSIYAGNSNPWQEIVSSAMPVAKSLPHSLANSLPMKVSTSISSSSPRGMSPASVQLNGPAHEGQIIRQNLSYQQVGMSSFSHVAPSSLSGSVINANVTVSSSSTLPLPIPHQNNFTQSVNQQSAVSQTSSSLPLEIPSRALLASSSITLNSRASVTSFSSSSSVVQTSERLKSADSQLSFSTQQHQAANSKQVGSSFVTKISSPNLLNSLPEKNIDSQSSAESPPDIKVPSEGDENSNHSGLATDTLPEHSGTAALLEHAGVKTENQDSGVGSSSERSDVSPSDPGEGEFRSSNVSVEVEESSNKVTSQKTLNCKIECDLNIAPNTITVGYMMNPNEEPGPKLSLGKDGNLLSKTTVVASAQNSSASDISQYFDSHDKSVKKQPSLAVLPSVSKTKEEGKSQPIFTGKLRENGPCPDDVSNNSNVKMNGPSSHASFEKMIMATVSEFQQKKMRASPKQNNVNKGLAEVPSEHLKLQAEVLEEMSKLHQFAESTRDTMDISTRSNSSDKADSPDAFSQGQASSEDRPDQLIFDMEELVNGKMLGNGAGALEGKGGSNITSIYSKRSSPVNVNMLNHIYAPGLPLPRRLTESVQRLVKPLPASETSVSLPQVRPCKSPGSGALPRASNSTNGQNLSRISFQSGTRSPGASMPKLIPNDKHSLVSGGLDLAGFTSLSSTGLSSVSISSQRGASLTADVLLKESHPFSSNQHSPPELLLDSKSFSQKMLSQSYPPHKSKDLSTTVTHLNHDLGTNLRSKFSPYDRNSLPTSFQNSQPTQLSPLKSEFTISSVQDTGTLSSNRLSQPDSTSWSNHKSDNISGQAQLVVKPSPADITHSSCNSVETSSAHSTHSNASSPVMPILQRGQEPPTTPTLASNMPSISSQPPSISSSKEISLVSSGSSGPSSNSSLTVSGLKKHVPYPINLMNTPGTSGSARDKSPTLCTSTSLPTLSPILTSTAFGKTDSNLAASPSSSTPPKLSIALVAPSTPPTLTKAFTSSNQLPSSSRTGLIASQSNRNLFESVSGTLTHQNYSSLQNEQRVAKNTGEILYPSKSQSDLLKSDSHVNLALEHKESKSSFMGKILEQKSGANIDVRVPVSQNSEMSKVSTPPKLVQTVEQVSVTNTALTQAGDLKYSVQSSKTNIVTIRSNSSCSDVKSNLPLSDSSQTSQPSTSLPPSLVTCTSRTSQSVDAVAETIASVAAGRDETSSKSSSFSSTALSVKEPILETFASVLGSTMFAKTASKPHIHKSICDNRISDPVTSSGAIERVGEDEVKDRKFVAIQSHPYKTEELNNKTPDDGHSQSSKSLAEANTESSAKRVTRKRKSTHSEGDSYDGETEKSSVEAIPVKQARPEQGNPSLAKPVSESNVPEITSYVSLGSQKLEHIENISDQGMTSQETDTQKKEDFQGVAGRSFKANEVVEEKDFDPAKALTISTSEDPELGSTREGRPQKSMASGSSDEGRSHRSSSNESRDSWHKEGRPHRTSTANGGDKESRPHRGNTTSSGQEKEQPKDTRLQRASSVDGKESSHRESRLHRIHNSSDDKESQRESPARSSSADDTDKIKAGKESCERGVHMDKAGIDAKDDGKKSHRIKRQFYAYVPEKSIDQTYFDTPILSGRTRSKNKPADQLEASQEGPASSNLVDSQQSANSQQGASGKAETWTDGTGVKRPIRSVRTKDSPQESSSSKRRRVQQNR